MRVAEFIREHPCGRILVVRGDNQVFLKSVMGNFVGYASLKDVLYEEGLGHIKSVPCNLQGVDAYQKPMFTKETLDFDFSKPEDITRFFLTMVDAVKNQDGCSITLTKDFWGAFSMDVIFPRGG